MTRPHPPRSATLDGLLLLAAAGGVVLGTALPALLQGAAKAGRNTTALLPARLTGPAYVERRVPRSDHHLYARDYPGEEPAFVLLHGFPDNLKIHDELAPLLAAGGRRVVAFDFLGFGASDKPPGFAYSFDQQEGDLLAVADALGLDTMTPVAHDAGGPAAINLVLAQPRRVAALVLLNCFYGETSALRFPELIELCSTPDLSALAKAIMTDPRQAKWLLDFQRRRFQVDATPDLKARFDRLLDPVITANFATQPSAGPAFLKMTADLRSNVASNSRRLAALKDLDVPVTLIWGSHDPYLGRAVAEDLAGRFAKAALHLLPVGHWPQIDDPKTVANYLLQAA